jgi:diaminohydroxyphosphoribosylaminopyrimidine deaminase/5-amino-6-(5-phosphoribosylamino)uracil reductase
VGAATVVHDDPQLTVRDWQGRNPVRIILDPQGSLPTTFRIFDDQAKTFSYTRTNSKSTGNVDWVKIGEQSDNHSNFIPEELPVLLGDLHRRGIQSIMVEGGAKTLALFLCTGLWDEARVFRSTQHWHEGISAPSINGEPEQVSNIGSDTLSVYRNRSAP